VVRVLAGCLLFALGLAGVAGGGVLLAREMTRPPTSAEKAAAVKADIASRWQRLPAGKIFPATLTYSTGGFNVRMTATLVGIAPRTSCAAGLDLGAARAFGRLGCIAVLRATYADASGTLLVTAGIVVMKDSAVASRAVSARLPAGAGVRTFALPGTIADQFGDAQRRGFSSATAVGPYLLLSASGYADGRVSGSAQDTPGLTDVSNGISLDLETALTKHGPACQTKDIRC
jgi:hypothetical protein